MKALQNHIIFLALAGLSFSTPCLAAKTKYIKVSPRQDLAALVRNARAKWAYKRMRLIASSAELIRTSRSGPSHEQLNC